MLISGFCLYREISIRTHITLIHMLASTRYDSRRNQVHRTLVLFRVCPLGCTAAVLDDPAELHPLSVFGRATLLSFHPFVLCHWHRDYIDQLIWNDDVFVAKVDVSIAVRH